MPTPSPPFFYFFLHPHHAGRIYKHFPFKWSRQDLDTIHGTDERVSIASLGHAARYFGQREGV